MDMGGMGDQPFDFGEALGAIEGESLEERVAREHAEGIAAREGAFAGQRVRTISISHISAQYDTDSIDPCRLQSPLHLQVKEFHRIKNSVKLLRLARRDVSRTPLIKYKKSNKLRNVKRNPRYASYSLPLVSLLPRDRF